MHMAGFQTGNNLNVTVAADLFCHHTWHWRTSKVWTSAKWTRWSTEPKFQCSNSSTLQMPSVYGYRSFLHTYWWKSLCALSMSRQLIQGWLPTSPAKSTAPWAGKTSSGCRPSPRCRSSSREWSPLKTVSSRSACFIHQSMSIGGTHAVAGGCACWCCCVFASRRSEACGGERRGGDHRVEPRRAAAGLRAGHHQRAGGGREGGPGPDPRLPRRRRPPRHRRLQGARPRRRRRIRKLANVSSASLLSEFVCCIVLARRLADRRWTHALVVAGREAGGFLPGGGGRGRGVQRPADAAGRVRAHHGAQRLHLPRRHHPQPHHHRVRQAPRHAVALVDDQ